MAFLKWKTKILINCFFSKVGNRTCTFIWYFRVVLLCKSWMKKCCEQVFFVWLAKQSKWDQSIIRVAGTRCNWKKEGREGDNNNRVNLSPYFCFYAATTTTIECMEMMHMYRFSDSRSLNLQTNFVLTLSILQLLHQGNLILPINALQACSSKVFILNQTFIWEMDLLRTLLENCVSK